MFTNGVRDSSITVDTTRSKSTLSSPNAQKQATGTAANLVANPVDIGSNTGKPSDTIQPIKLDAVVQQLNSYMESSERSITFSIHEDSGQTVVKVYNSITDELIRQFPSEDILKLSETFAKNGDLGVFIDAEV